MDEGALDGLRLSPSASFHVVEGGAVVFHAGQGRLYALNSVAGLTWLSLLQGSPHRVVAQSMTEAFAIDGTTAAEWVRQSLHSFRELGLIDSGSVDPICRAPPAPRPLRPGLARGLRYRLFDKIFAIEAAPDAIANLRTLLSNCGPLTATSFEPVDVALRIEPSGSDYNLIVDDDCVARADRSSIAAEVERHLLQTLVPNVPHLLALHAAAVQYRGTTLLLAGPSGAGKTTFSMALVRAGSVFGTDELVLIDRDRALRPLPFAPCIKADAFSLVGAWFPGLEGEPVQRRYGRGVKYLSIEAQPLPVAPIVVLFPSYMPGETATLRALAPFTGLERLLAHCVFVPPGFEAADVDTLLQWHRGLRYFELSFDDCDDAVACLSGLTRSDES